MSKDNPPTQEALTPEQQRIADLEAQLARTQAQLAGIERQSEGWLVTTDNPIYDGSMYGVAFTNGAAFIPVDQVLEAFAVKPEPVERIKQRHMHIFRGALDEAEKREAADYIKGVVTRQREREKMTTAERAAEHFAGMKGYKVEYFASGQHEQLRARLAERTTERRQAEARLQARTQAEQFFPPGFEGVSGR